jgi:hypothetical protein
MCTSSLHAARAKHVERCPRCPAKHKSEQVMRSQRLNTHPSKPTAIGHRSPTLRSSVTALALSSFGIGALHAWRGQLVMAKALALGLDEYPHASPHPTSIRPTGHSGERQLESRGRRTLRPLSPLYASLGTSSTSPLPGRGECEAGGR